MIELTANQPSRVAQILEQVVIGSDQERRASTLIVPDDQSGLLLVRAPGFGSRGDRPFHFLDRVTRPRLSLGLRHDAH